MAVRVVPATSPGNTRRRLTITEWTTTDLDCPTREAIDVETALFEALTRPIEARIDLDQNPARLGDVVQYEDSYRLR